jgi:hypothetical protein
MGDYVTLAETKRVIKFLFERSGKNEPTEQQLELVASMELRWFTPKNAKKILDYANKLRLFESSGDGKLVLNFDPDDIQIPVGFKPHEDLLDRLEEKLEELVQERQGELEVQSGAGKKDEDKCEQAREDLFMKIISRITEEKNVDKTEVISRINKKQRKVDLEIEVLALLVAQEYGVDVKDILDEVESELARRVRDQF